MEANETIHKEFSKFILSASGWRKVFAISGDENDSTTEVSNIDQSFFWLASVSFLEFLKNNNIHSVVIGRDSRPTGKVLEQIAFSALSSDLDVKVIGIASAPEIMAHAKITAAAFMYISASHNPIGHNGLKFGLPTGGVLYANDANLLINRFKEKVQQSDNFNNVVKLHPIPEDKCEKEMALNNYMNFSEQVIVGSNSPKIQESFYDTLTQSIAKYNKTGIALSVLCDFNGSARAVSIDNRIFEKFNIKLFSINNEVGKIAHGIIPEGKNLNFCMAEMEKLYTENKMPVLGYMPDCDGDRGNIVYYDCSNNQASLLVAQSVFALSVIAELSYMQYANLTDKPFAIAVNGPTSLCIEEIAKAFGAKVFRAEVGEANVVGLAAILREQGYAVRILGEGSNGGNITYPSSVRDPLNTIFAILKLLLLRGDDNKKGLFYNWCRLSNQLDKYTDDFSLSDIIRTIPAYTTTPTQEDRALMKIKTMKHSKLKQNFKSVFEREWLGKKAYLKEKYGICRYEPMTTNGMIEKMLSDDFGVSGRGGLKIQFYDQDDNKNAFIWMRGSGTEPVFRIMADIKGFDESAEKDLVEWEGRMVLEADKQGNK